MHPYHARPSGIVTPSRPGRHLRHAHPGEALDCENAIPAIVQHYRFSRAELLADMGHFTNNLCGNACHTILVTV